jgi:hypothetical protein
MLRREKSWQNVNRKKLPPSELPLGGFFFKIEKIFKLFIQGNGYPISFIHFHSFHFANRVFVLLRLLRNFFFASVVSNL